MGDNGRDFGLKYLLSQIVRQCASSIVTQKYGGNYNKCRNNNGFGNSGDGNNNGFHNNNKQNSNGFRQQTHQAQMVTQMPTTPYLHG